MAPVYKSGTLNSAVSGTTHTLVLPNTGDGAAVGDFAILVFATSGLLTSGDPSGWTPLTGTPTTATASGGKFYIWTKTLIAGDLGATISWTVSATARSAEACITTSAATLSASAKDETNTAGTGVIAPTVTPGTASDLLVSMHGVLGNAAGVPITWTADATTVGRIDSHSANGTLRDATFLIATQTLSSGAATGTRTATPSASVQRQGVSLALTSAVITAPSSPLPLISSYNSFH